MAFTELWGRAVVRTTVAALVAGLLADGAAWAQATPPRPKPPEAADSVRPAAPAVKPGDLMKSPADPVVAVVEGRLVHLSDVGRAIPTLPQNLRGLPFDTLFPIVLDRIIDHQALVALARRKQLEEEPQVRRDLQAAAERILEGALLAREALPAASEEKIQARYAQQYAGRPATEETRARHILVSTEAEAKRLIAELNKGADFPTLAKQSSKDPDRETGGDLGFFRRDQVWPDFADLAFSLQPGQFSQTPIKNEFGWHVVKVEERRIVAPPTYSDMYEKLRQALLQEAIQRTIDQARSQLAIRKFNVDGSQLGAVPDITPPQPMVKPPETPQRP